MALAQNLRLGFRLLAKHPVLSIISIVTLGLGIGLTATMYSIVRGALADLPFDQADRILHLERNNLAAGEESLEVPLHDFLDWRAAQKSFESLAAYYDGTMNLSGGEDKPERFSGGFLTANTFEVLRVKPILGRDFLPGEDAPGAEPVAILSHDLWQQRFHGDPAIVGKAIRINGISRTVVGVMPEGFLFPLREKLWMPLPLDTSKIKRGEGTTLEVIGRIRSGLTLAQARAEFSGIAERLAHQYPDTNKGVGSVVKPFTEEYIDDEPRQLLYTMLTAVFGVLLIACANVANLLLARTALRSREVAVSSALGASRGRIITQILSEAFLLALPGALLGLLIAQWGVELFNQALLPADPPFWIHIRVDYGVLLFVLGLALLSALVAGLTPALQASGRKAGEVLKDESRGSSGFRIGRISRTLVIAEVALSFGLLVAAGLTVKSVVELRNRNWGFETHHLYTSRMALFPQDYPEAPQRAQFFRELLERVQALPEVKSAAIVDSLPVLGSGGDYIAIEGQEHAANEYPTARLSTVSPAYFDTVGVKAVAGRLFDDHDREGSTPVVLINQSMAKQFFAKTSPLGQRLRWPANDPKAAFRTIVGVVPDLFMSGPRNREPAGFYMPLAQGDLAFANVIARTTSAPMDIAPAVQRSVNAIDANMPLYWVESLDHALSRRNWFYPVFGTLFLIFGGVALFLSAIGLYGVMAFSVYQRTHEVGIRMALGAEAGQVLKLILRNGSRQLGWGMLVGLGIAAALSQGLKMLLFQVQPLDPTVFLTIGLVLAGSGLAACLIPARRASRTSPMVALK